MARVSLIEQYDLTLSKREMDELMLAMRTFVREFDASEAAVELLAYFEDAYRGPAFGIGIVPTELPPDENDEDGDAEGGAAVKA